MGIDCRTMSFFCTRSLMTKARKISFRVPKHIAKHPKHRTYEQTEYPLGSFQDVERNFVGQFPKRLARPIIPVQYLFKGDYVYISYGVDKGKRGVVEQVLEKEAKVFVQGRNCIWEKQERAYEGGVQIEYIKKEKPLLMQHVSLIDPQAQQPTNIDFKYNELGDLVRVSKTSGRIIPYPEQTKDNVRADGPNDTPKDICLEKTYEMKLESFEDSILKEMGLQHEIEERAKKHPTWFY